MRKTYRIPQSKNAKSLSTTSNCLLNTFRDDDSAASLGSWFQCFTTLLVKSFFLICYLNLAWHNLGPSPLLLLLITWEERLIPTLLSGSCRAIRCPLILLFSRENNPNFPCCSAQDLCSRPFPAPLPSGYTPAPQGLSCRKGPKTEYRIQTANEGKIIQGTKLLNIKQCFMDYIMK